jgi:regulatory factor X
MASTHRRSQSKPTRIARPVSSASTASAHSQEQSHQQQGHPFQQSHNYGQQQFNDHYAHLQPVLLQAAQHVSQQSQQENVSQDPVHQLVGFNPSNAAMASSSMPASGSYSNGLPLQSLDPNMQQPQHHIHHHQYSASVATSAASVEPEEKRKKSSAAGNATNDKELREMLKRNDGRRLDDVAAEVIATDRTSRAEKSKQLFAMLW